jgi:pre-mRNA-splicing factor CWC26
MATSLEAYLEKHYSRKENKEKRKKDETNEDDRIVKQHDNNIDTDNNSENHNNESLINIKKSNENLKLNESSASWIDVETKSTITKNSEQSGKSVKPPVLKGGLQTREELEKELQEKEYKLQKEKEMLLKLNNGLIHKTIHRDSKGRRLTDSEIKDLEDKRNIKRHHSKSKYEIDNEIAFRNRNEAGIQREHQMRERLNKLKDENLNIYENDEKLIQSKKDEILSEDPALLFDKKLIKKHKENLDKEFVSITGRKLYKDITRYPLNRFKTRPGWRWDGIVRGNGFEQKFFDVQKK